MAFTEHRKSIAFFIAFGACLVAIAVTLNVGWIFATWRTGLLFILGVISFLVIISGVVLNTIFLVREVRRNEQHDTFINAVTHELKTPVASIRLYLETLKRREVEEAKRKEFYDIMLADSDRLLHTIEQVLRAGKAGRARKQRIRAKIDLRELVQDCLAISRMRHHLPEEALAYEEDPGTAADAMTVLGDIDDLKAAVSNLLDNAVKYSGPNVRVTAELARVEKRYLAVRIKDSGIGIPQPELNHIFKRFYRIPEAVALRIKGTGLGLFIVRSVVERHGGKAFASSEGPGRGSTFTIQLPAAPVS